MRTVKAWTTRELAILRQEYPHTPTREIAAKLGRTTQVVYAAAANHGLKKSVEFFATSASGRILKGGKLSIATQFKPGHVSANKGLRRPGYAPGRMAETQFKKGQRPHTYRWSVGSARMQDGYYYRKVAEAQPWTKAWKQVHRMMWEEHYGPIPAGHVVVFRDRNPNPPILLGNLELVTKADLARRNALWTRYPEDLARAIHAVGIIKRKVRRRAREQDDHRPARQAFRDDRQA